MVDLISTDVDKEPYIKKLTEDRVINLTGQSGSGKSTYARKTFYDEKYVIIDTDVLLKKHNFESGYYEELKQYLEEKYHDKEWDLGKDFDLIYKEILNFFKGCEKILVIDCAQFHCINDIRILKGTVIVLRTSIDTCYKRCVERYKENHPSCSDEELEQYKNRKKKIYDWYHGTNEFLKKIDAYKVEDLDEKDVFNK